MLKGLKVLELAGVLAGPAVGMFFAELGAAVTKIENPGTNGDITRQWKVAGEDPTATISAYFATVNWGKKHIFIDLTTQNGYAHFIELVKQTDVIIVNWKKGDDVRYKADYATLRLIRPDIIYAAITGFGEDNDRVAYDLILQAETGWMHMTGDAASAPLKIPVAVIDIFAAHQLKEGILIALYHRLKTGEGARITVSLFDAAVASLANQAANYLNTGLVPQRNGSLHPNIAPYGELVTCSDDVDIVLAIGTDKQFLQLCNVLHIKEINELFLQNQSRVTHRAAVLDLLQHHAKGFPSAILLAQCHAKKIPVARIRNLKELFQVDAARDLILEDSDGKRVRTAIFKMHFSANETAHSK